MDEIKKEDCYICYDKLDYEKQALLKPRCGHMYHGKCLLQLTRKPNKNKCAYCRRKVVLMRTYKKNRFGVLKWTREPHRKIRIKLKLVGMKRNVDCLVCKNQLKGCVGNVECRSCFHSVHKNCIQKTSADTDEAGVFECARCETMDFSAPFCFICYKSDTLKKLQCFWCSVWCHVDCYPQTMRFMPRGWCCNWCIFKITPILMDRGFDRAWKKVQIHKNTTTWAEKRCDPLLPERFYDNALKYLFNAVGKKETYLEMSEKLLSIFAESFNLNTRKLRNREVLVPQQKLVGKRLRLTWRFFYATDTQINKLNMEFVAW